MSLSNLGGFLFGLIPTLLQRRRAKTLKVLSFGEDYSHIIWFLMVFMKATPFR
jgi:hypothetical protein